MFQFLANLAGPALSRALLVVLLIAVGAGCRSDEGHPFASRAYHDPSFGWTAAVPALWASCDVPGGQFTRGLPTQDPTRLILWTYRERTPQEVLRLLREEGSVINQAETGERNTAYLRWRRYRGAARSEEDLSVELAVASEGADTHLALLVAPRAEADKLVRNVLLPAVDSFEPGPPDPPASVLAAAPPEPDYWPAQGWRKTLPEAQRVDSNSLDVLTALIRREKLPIDSIFAVRHGYVVLDVAFRPHKSGELHDLHSVTKSVTSALVGIALEEAGDASVDTPVLALLAPEMAARADQRKQAMTLEHLLTMTAGLEWTEWGAAYEPGTGNDLVQMITTSPRWAEYVLSRPAAADPGEAFLYNSGASYLLSAAVGKLAGMPAADFAENRLFNPLGITEYEWPASPEGVTIGWGDLRLSAPDLAKIGLLYLQRGAWDGRQIVPADWVEASTTDWVAGPWYEYGYQWWLDRADGYAYMSGRFGQTVIVAPEKDMVIVITASLPEDVSGALSVPRWLAETYILPAAR